MSNPICVDGFMSEALRAARSFSERISDVQTIIMDDWNTGAHVQGARLVYTARCPSLGPRDCDSCPVHQFAGEDEPSPDPRPRFRASLCRAREDQQQLFESDRPFLNCRTLEEYETAFVRWTVQRCSSLVDFEAELRWIVGFRMVAFKGVMVNTDSLLLRKAERESKTRILEAIVVQYPNDAFRRYLARQTLDRFLRH